MRKIHKAFWSYIFILIILVTGVVFSSAYNKVATYTFESSIINQTPIVIIDAGHGGEDGGAIASDGTFEKDINLNIAHKLNLLMQQSGIAAKMTRDTDSALGDINLGTTKQRYRSGIKERLEIYNASEDNIVISIHQNKFSDSKYKGTQIFYSANNPESQLLATSVQKSVVSLLQPDNSREIKQAQNNIYLMKNAQIPAVIVECGFLSNPEEAALLTQEEYQEKIAFSIYLGFLNYYYDNY